MPKLNEFHMIKNRILQTQFSMNIDIGTQQKKKRFEFIGSKYKVQ